MPGPETIYARDGMARLAERLQALGARRIMVLSSPSRRFVDQVVGAVQAREPLAVTTVFDGARVHVPAEVVEAATRAFEEARPDTLVAVGGGSPIGLGKALRLTHQVRFVAVPTTYAGSEMTSIWGVTRGTEKTTGRDARVRPDLVLYDPTLTATLPITVTMQSLMNALAHVVSALSTASLAGDARAAALAAAAALVRVMEDLLMAPTDLGLREDALRAASAAAGALDAGKAGAQHAAAHVLGGAFGLDHAALHSVLLPQFLALARERDAPLVAELESAIGCTLLEAQLHDLLTRAGAPTSLDGLKVDLASTKKVLDAHPDLPAAMVLDAQVGLRPNRARLELGAPPLAILSGPHPESARRVVLALHGRGAEAGGIVRRYSEIGGHDPDVAVIGLRADAGSNRWYGVRYGEAGAGADAEVVAALARVDAGLGALARWVPRSATVLAGFSQGACLALEYAARKGAGLAAVIAPCGARIGPPSEWPRAEPGSLPGMPVLLGAAAKDAWTAGERIDATAAWFREAGAIVEVLASPGERHDISPRQRLRARELVRGERAGPGASGFGNTVESEAVAGALPRHQNSPLRPPMGLYAEQINGAAFTTRRVENLRTWCYRVRPAAQRRAFAPLAHPRFGGGFAGRAPEINLAGWAPLPAPAAPADFVDGLCTVAGAGSPELRRGCAVHLYSADRDMDRRAFYDADGDLLLVPVEGALTVLTELGPLEVAPGQIAIVPRGFCFSVLLAGPVARGYLAEVFGRHFQLPERGPVGANGLTDPRHFRAPAPFYEDKLAPDFRIVGKLGGRLQEASQDHSPFDVVAWHGNYFPCRYDLAHFSPVGAVRIDHPDPSVYTVLSAPLDEPGTNSLDFIVFPPRWDVALGTFRPPYFHRNPVSEVNGIVRESSPPGSPFQPGCCFVTPPLTAHGPSRRAVERARSVGEGEADRPVPPGDSLWFQFETSLPLSLTPWADEHRLPDWAATWGSHRSYFRREAGTGTTGGSR
jgi:homogentisate 1,2-dioxygenase